MASCISHISNIPKKAFSVINILLSWVYQILHLQRKVFKGKTREGSLRIWGLKTEKGWGLGVGNGLSLSGAQLYVAWGGEESNAWFTVIPSMISSTSLGSTWYLNNFCYFFGTKIRSSSWASIAYLVLDSKVEISTLKSKRQFCLFLALSTSIL